MSEARSMLVCGAGGVVGLAALRHFSALPGWNAVGLSRRRPELAAAVAHLPCDLADPAAVDAALAGRPGITHVVYAALHEQADVIAGWRATAQIERNRQMLANLLDGLARHADGFRHLTLLQGTKAYGAHLHRMAIPGRERAPRDPHPNFYWAQEDLLAERQAKGHGWHYSIFRPQIVCGVAAGNPLNAALTLAVYGSIQKTLGEPFHFPGSRRMLTEATDARLMARAFAWAADAEAARGRTFNVTNGDPLCWWDLWPALARLLGLPMGEARPASLAATMPAHAALWDDLVRRYGLRPHGLEGLIGGSWPFADYMLGNGLESPPPTLLSGIELRRAGFADCIDTEDMFVELFAEMRAERLIPPA